MAIKRSKESTPPPIIGKIGPYTVFITPPSTPTAAPNPPPPAPPQPPAPPVQPPPQQFKKPGSLPHASALGLGFFRNAFAEVQKAHSSLDEFVAHWFGLNKSKYQWALDDSYEQGNKGSEQVDAKAKNISGKVQNV
ncbi:uncharacterized protein LOC127806683 [Diospyros lotus]|uniref:uncharacterized protein LOC127806683 n=1 Tax=Diospyros lotus TaxID=55363 RepID=UPI00225AAFE0|nr:uncharacterized protein LOC127806683 [Diospyros lotus]XP_052200082.1 uncharacterized protein LOC127806683 [Diospyros lotus]